MTSFLTFSWNIEGFSRNIYNLRHLIDQYHPDFIMLSEPQIYSPDLSLIVGLLATAYSFSLNSADQHDPELPLLKSKAHGGTMVLWKHELDPFVSCYQVSTTAFLPLVFCPPGLPPSVHIAVYLPTAGQESRFLEELSNLSIVIDDILVIYPGALLYLRGDFNVSHTNVNRAALLRSFLY